MIYKDIKNILLEKTTSLMAQLEGKDDLEDDDDITPEMKQALQESLGEDSRKILNLEDDEAFIDMIAGPSMSELNTKVPKQKRVSFGQDNFDTDTFCNKHISNPGLFNSTLFEDEQGIRKHKLVPISQWGVHFSGDNKFSINAFIERVDELRDARNATNADLWRHAIDFFKGDALIWFRANREYVNNWNELVVLLKRTFQSPYYQDELLAEAKSRTQGSNEPVLIFISVMQNLFNRLPNKISETDKIMIIIKNLQPYYQKAVCRDVFVSIVDLVNVLRILEVTKINCDNFKEPKTFVNSLEPDLAYRGIQTLSENKEIIEIKNVEKNNNVITKMRCWNCRESGHLFRSCKVPKQRLFCYRCGRFGVTSKDCRCKENSTGESLKPAN